MATWYARNTKIAGGWGGGNQTTQAGPSVNITGTIPSLTGDATIANIAPTTITVSANIQDSSNVAVPDGLTVLVMDGTTLTKVAEVLTTSGTGQVSWSNTQVPPHNDCFFVLPIQTGWLIETVVTPNVTGV